MLQPPSPHNNNQKNAPHYYLDPPFIDGRTSGRKNGTRRVPRWLASTAASKIDYPAWDAMRENGRTPRRAKALHYRVRFPRRKIMARKSSARPGKKTRRQAKHSPDVT